MRSAAWRTMQKVWRKSSNQVNLLMRMMRGASMLQWSRFASFEHALDTAYCYDRSKREALLMSQRDTVDFPWPVLLLISTYSRKHIFQSNKAPDQIMFAKDVKGFVNKIRWFDVLRDSEPGHAWLRAPAGRPPGPRA